MLGPILLGGSTELIQADLSFVYVTPYTAKPLGSWLVYLLTLLNLVVV